jgi:PRTRC system protein E
MFFQTIYPMLAAGTDLSINIRRVNDRLSVAVMPRHAGVKDEAQQNLVPLILSGTAVELDACDQRHRLVQPDFGFGEELPPDIRFGNGIGIENGNVQSRMSEGP